MKNILAVATVSEEFPQGLSIYNLPEFLGATSFWKTPTLNSNDALYRLQTTHRHYHIFMHVKEW